MWIVNESNHFVFFFFSIQNTRADIFRGKTIFAFRFFFCNKKWLIIMLCFLMIFISLFFLDFNSPFRRKNYRFMFTIFVRSFEYIFLHFDMKSTEMEENNQIIISMTFEQNDGTNGMEWNGISCRDPVNNVDVICRWLRFISRPILIIWMRRSFKRETISWRDNILFSIQ